MYGKILKVDLTKRKIGEEPIPREWQIKYIGGEGINDRLLWEHFLGVDPGIDPLSPDNILICGVGPLGATGALGAGTKAKWTFKSPAYNSFGDSVSGGLFVSQLRFTGYDHIVITGRAEQPVYLWISDGGAEIRDAAELWGKDVHIADSMIKEELGSPEIETAMIGQAGENLVRFASIILSRTRSAGRTGGGCVMGSKHLKAIAVRGSKGVKISDPRRLLELTAEAMRLTAEAMRRAVKSPHLESHRVGTTFLVRHLQKLGCHCWHNYQDTQVPEGVIKKADADFFLRNFKTYSSSCSAGCIAGCCQSWTIKGDETPASAGFVGEFGRKLDFIPISSCFCWGAEDLAAICHITKLWDTYGMDAIEIGGIIGFLMELYQRGIITERDMEEWTGEPLALKWGDYEAAERITESVVMRKNKFYDALSRGVYETARRIEELKGVPVLKYCQYGGKHSPEMEDVRNRRAWTVGFATSTRGADHNKAFTVIEQNRYQLSEAIFGSPHGGDGQIPHLKGLVVAWEGNRIAAINSTGLCLFNTMTIAPLGPGVDLMAEAYTAVTGLELEPEDLLLAGERAYNIEKAFNARLGFSRKDDTLCERWMKEPIPEGRPGAGMKCEDCFDLMLDEYYEYRGWDPETGLQTRARLEELGLGDIADVLEREHVLSPARPRAKEEVLGEAIRKADDFKRAQS